MTGEYEKYKKIITDLGGDPSEKVKIRSLRDKNQCRTVYRYRLQFDGRVFDQLENIFLRETEI